LQQPIGVGGELGDADRKSGRAQFGKCGVSDEGEVRNAPTPAVAAFDAVWSGPSLPFDLCTISGAGESRDGSRDHGSTSDTINGAEADG